MQQPSSHRRPLVLVVDDDAPTCECLQELLAEEGYDVAVAANGEEGLAMANECHPAAAIVDLRMPVMGGLSFCSEVRHLSGLADLPLLVMSASTQLVEEVAPGLVSGILRKPMHIEELLDALTRALGGEPGGRSPAR